jgi:outer membrane receptor protein involved in Fe transport
MDARDPVMKQFGSLFEITRCLALLSLFLGPGSEVFAQGTPTGTISGQITDPDNLALPGVAVTVTSQVLLSPLTTVTASTGEYSVSALVPGDYTVTFELQGFAPVKRTVTVKAGDTQAVTVSVKMALAAMSEVVNVVGSQIEGAKVNTSLPVTVIGTDQIQAAAAGSGDELFRTIPQAGNVTFNSSFLPGSSNSARGDVNSISLRNLGAGNTLVLLNGRRTVVHPTTQAESLVPVFTYNTNAIPVSGLKRVEVLRDGASAIYGADAVAGVINTVLENHYTGGSFEAQFAPPRARARRKAASPVSTAAASSTAKATSPSSAAPSAVPLCSTPTRSSRVTPTSARCSRAPSSRPRRASMVAPPLRRGVSSRLPPPSARSARTASP